MNKEIKEKWVAALRSGKYQQGECELRNLDNCFCCLGVLCDIIDNNSWKEMKDSCDNPTGYDFWYKKTRHDEKLPEALAFECEISDDEQDELINLNDVQYANFQTIANYIEKNL